MKKEKLEEILERHKKWLSGEEHGERADLRCANLRGAYLKGADLRGADPDFSVLPLWRGGLGIIVDARIARQIAYHFCVLECEDEEFIEARNAILDFANKFHRVGKCGVLERR